jgi:Skp family chaperone for outer membrane proteins
MKSNRLILVLLVFVFVFLGYEMSRAAPEVEDGRIRIGVASMQQVFRDSRRVAGYMQRVQSERVQTEARLEKLDKEIQAEQAGLKTLVRGSSDYMSQLREILQKQAELQTEQEFYKQNMSAEKQRMTEQLYRDILEATQQVAKERRLDLVFERSEPEFPMSGPGELELAMGTHKVLYSGSCVDITAEVTSRIDAEEVGK